jgi:hypothetical protein
VCVSGTAVYSGASESAAADVDIHARPHFDLGQSGLGGAETCASAAADVYSHACSHFDLGQNGLGGARTCASAAPPSTAARACQRQQTSTSCAFAL